MCNPSKKCSVLLIVCGAVCLLAGILSVLLPMLIGGAPVGIIGGAELPTLRYLYLLYLLCGRRLLVLLLGAALLLAGLCVLFFAKKIKKK